jgi:phospholipase/lecithinase/hemolysin
MKIRMFSVVVFIVLGLFTATASAYTSIISFGDSLSDTGNFGRWTNGNVWNEYLASDLGATLDNRSIGGAETIGNSGYSVFGLDWQISQYSSLMSGSPIDTLFTVWIGGNDHLTSDRDHAVAASNAAASLQALINLGATGIMVLNLPDLGAVPRFNGDPTGEAAAQAFSINYNAALEAEVNALATANSFVNFFMVDVFGLMQDVISDPAAYGLSNVDDYPTGSNYDGYLFYDDIHPTTAAHREIADLAGRSLSAVPLPGAVWLLGSGVLGLFGIRRRVTSSKKI